MSPTIHCVRHAQGYHNLTTANHHMHDPLLTPYGEQQCSDLQQTFPNQDSIDLIVASPIKRTLHTALLSFSDNIEKKGLKVIALPELQETSDLPCDTGSEREELEKEFAGKSVDLGLVSVGWNCKRGRWAPQSRAIERRARDARLWLQGRSEQNIVVVTHGGFLHYFTEDFHDQDRFAGTGWANCEFRSYTFSPHDPLEAHLKETPESRERRKGDRKPLDLEEHVNLQRTATEEQVRAVQAKV